MPMPRAAPALARCIAVLLCLLGAWPAQAQGPARSEAELKAEVLYRVLMFVEWPLTKLPADPVLSLCLYEPGPMAPALQALAGRKVHQRALLVRQTGLDSLGACHALWLGQAADIAALATPGRGLLMVSEGNGPLGGGQMLRLQVEDGRIVFDIELNEVRRAGLDMSAKLLRLARFVRKD